MVLLKIVLNLLLNDSVWLFIICVLMLCVWVVIISFGDVFMLWMCVLFRVSLVLSMLLL